MTAKEKAYIFVYKYYKEIKYHERAKKCALIAVAEIMDALDKNGGGWDSKYWEEVKAEIEKL